MNNKPAELEITAASVSLSRPKCSSANHAKLKLRSQTILLNTVKMNENGDERLNVWTSIQQFGRDEKRMFYSHSVCVSTSTFAQCCTSFVKKYSSCANTIVSILQAGIPDCKECREHSEHKHRHPRRMEECFCIDSPSVNREVWYKRPWIERWCVHYSGIVPITCQEVPILLWPSMMATPRKRNTLTRFKKRDNILYSWIWRLVSTKKKGMKEKKVSCL